MPITVVIQKMEQEERRLIEQFTRSFSDIGLGDDFNKARAVFIKPNLTYPQYKEGVTTRFEYVKSLVAALRMVNDRTKIYIGEGAGGYNAYCMSEALLAMGYHEIEKEYPNISVVNVSALPRRQVALEAAGKPYLIELPNLFYEEIDFSITCPVPKVHCMTKITLSFKNQWGCVPDTMRLKNHYVFDEIISQIAQKLKFKYAFLDGKYGLDINGPMMGVPVEVNWFVASNSLGAFDQIVAEMMGVDWRKVGHLRMAEKQGCMPKREDMAIVGDITALKREFTLKRDIWNYPALAAFYSKELTHLFYFSRWAKLLHDIMYTFRKRPIS